MYTIAIHGGAGLSSIAGLPEELDREARQCLSETLQAAAALLGRGGSALDAVELAVCMMEDSPVFNAGRGSVFSADGVQRMDASIMDGATLGAGSLCGATRIRNPVKAARAIMEKTPHVMFDGPEAERTALAAGLPLAEPGWFYTEYRWQQLLRTRASGAVVLDHDEVGSKGTVGAVALDAHGDLAAATSTGGMVNKPPGRIGDSALIGAGTYADNRTCAVSATGHGEVFIRHHVAGRLSDLVGLAGMDLPAAARRLVHAELPDKAGGLIAVDTLGNISMPFNTGGMFRGYTADDGRKFVAIWNNEEERG